MLANSLYGALTNRQWDSFTNPKNNSCQRVLKNFTSGEKDSYRFLSSSEATVPPFACSFSNKLHGGHCLAVADEEGSVHLINTLFENTIENECKQTHWNAHDNAIFDINWSPDDAHIVTASGDQTARIWDISTLQCITSLEGHISSVKTTSFHPTNPNQLVSAGRDGNILVWDLRTSFRTNNSQKLHRPINTIINAHAQNLSQVKKRRRRVPSGYPSEYQQSVTSAKFLIAQENWIASSGAADGCVKYWDLRFIKKPVGKSEENSAGKRIHGISSLCQNSTGTSLFATSTDNCIYQYDCGSPGRLLSTFSSHSYKCSSFYIKSSVSPDDRFVCSGSTDGGVYIWEVDFPSKPAVVLQKHESEVSSVSWCGSDLTKVASCSDDGSIRLWQMRPELAEQLIKDNTLKEMFGYALTNEVSKDSILSFSRQPSLSSITDSANFPTTPSRQILSDFNHSDLQTPSSTTPFDKSKSHDSFDNNSPCVKARTSPSHDGAVCDAQIPCSSISLTVSTASGTGESRVKRKRQSRLQEFFSKPTSLDKENIP